MKIITSLNISAAILTVCFLITLLSGYERVASLTSPSVAKEYHRTLGNKKKEFRGKKLGIGHVIDFEFKENKKSLDERYSLTDITFIPQNKSFKAWRSGDRLDDLDEKLDTSRPPQRFRIKFSMKIPADRNLENRTLKGLLRLKLSYPSLVKYPERKKIIKSTIFEKPVSIHIFSQKKLDRLADLTGQMKEAWLKFLLILFCPIFLVVLKIINNFRKIHPAKVQ